MPLCTVAIPVYNRAYCVERALRSALSQQVTNADVQALVIDNCSTDGTWELLQSLAATEPRLRVLRNNTNIGWVGNFNRCIREAQGDYLVLLGSDDVILSGALQHEIDLLQRHPSVSLVNTCNWRVNPQGERQSRSADHMTPGVYRGGDVIASALWVLATYSRGVFNYPAGLMMRLSAVRLAGEFDAAFKHVADMDFCFRLLMHGDAAFSDQAGCEVTDDAGTLTDNLLVNGEFTREWFGLARRWKSQLSPPLLGEVLRRSAAWSLYYAYFYARRGNLKAARAYLGASLKHPMPPAAWFAAVRHVRATSRNPHSADQPFAPYAAL